jgi:hypothetical protein
MDPTVECVIGTDAAEQIIWLDAGNMLAALKIDRN